MFCAHKYYQNRLASNKYVYQYVDRDESCLQPKRSRTAKKIATISHMRYRSRKKELRFVLKIAVNKKPSNRLKCNQRVYKCTIERT